MEKNKSFFHLDFYNYISSYTQVPPPGSSEDDEFYDVILDGGEVTL